MSDDDQVVKRMTAGCDDFALAVVLCSIALRNTAGSGSILKTSTPAAQDGIPRCIASPYFVLGPMIVPHCGTGGGNLRPYGRRVCR